MKLNREEAARSLGDPNASATALHLVLLASYGPSALYDHWDKDGEFVEADSLLTTRDRVREDFGVDVPEENMNKLRGIALVMESDQFYDDPEVFHTVCMCLSDGDMGNRPQGGDDTADPAEVIWAIKEAGLNRGDDTPPEFSPAVRAAAKAVLGRGGWEDFAGAVSADLTDAMDGLSAELGLLGVDEDDLGRLLAGFRPVFEHDFDQ